MSHHLKGAQCQFDTSSLFPVPKNYPGKPWAIRNDYPAQPDTDEYPWQKIDFWKPGEAEKYAYAIREYCFKGNTDREFIVQENKDRNWYHAPWLHYSSSGREPLHGLTYERVTPPRELAKTQDRHLEMWACGFFNSASATEFHKMWKDTSNPDWDADVHFNKDTVICKVFMTDATDKELPFMKGSPVWDAVITPSHCGTAPTSITRNDFASPVRLIQMDFAVKDERKQVPTGWVFGTFIYDGSSYTPKQESEADKWNRLIPVGIQWGNDPELTQSKFESGQGPHELWLNPAADKLREGLGGTRPWWGWNGRMNGPADNFISACLSCHATAERRLMGLRQPEMTQPPPKHIPGTKKWVPQNDKETMNWFRNVGCGDPFSTEPPKSAYSADYSLQLMIGYENFQTWKLENGLHGTMKLEPPPGRRYPGPEGPVVRHPETELE